VNASKTVSWQAPEAVKRGNGQPAKHNYWLQNTAKREAATLDHAQRHKNRYLSGHPKNGKHLMESLLLEVAAQHDTYLKKRGANYRQQKSRQQIARNYKAAAKVASSLRTLKQQKQQGVKPEGANNATA
jgi:hypothetical protein